MTAGIEARGIRRVTGDFTVIPGRVVKRGDHLSKRSEPIERKPKHAPRIPAISPGRIPLELIESVETLNIGNNSSRSTQREETQIRSQAPIGSRLDPNVVHTLFDRTKGIK